MQRIVVDAMGGDHGAEEIIHGAAEASLALSDVELILVGDAAASAASCPKSPTTARASACTTPAR